MAEAPYNGFIAIAAVFFLLVADALPKPIVAVIVISAWKGLEVYVE
jgi:hypothetical protein